MIDDDWVSIESGNLFEKRKFRNNKVVEKQTELKTVTVDASSTPEAMMLTKRKNSCAHSFDENPWHCSSLKYKRTMIILGFVSHQA